MLYHRNGKVTLISDSSPVLTESSDQDLKNTSEEKAGALDLSAATDEKVAAAEISMAGGEILLTEPYFVEDVEDAHVSHGIRTSYEVLCDLDNELVQKMKQYSESLYNHSVRIGDLSLRAALEVGADEMLALAGGLYHEVGKINGKNYIEEGLIIAEEYAFPKELKAILKEHNIKYEKPNSVEAAIVMLSDNVVSTIEYIEKNDDHKFSSNKVILASFIGDVP
jgi:putative nucleotidyltransferase with HDIG domain